MNARGNNHGMVLVYVLGIVATLAALLAAVQVESRLELQRLQAVFRDAEAAYMAYSPVLLTRHLLEADLAGGAQVDGPGDNWYRFSEARTFPVEGGSIRLHLYDAAARPDINHLFTGKGMDEYYDDLMKTYFRRLNVDSGLVPPLTDWVDPDTRARSGGGETARPPGRVGNADMLMPTELSLLPGLEGKTVKTLAENLSFLPTDVAVNVNTASREYLEVIFGGYGSMSRAVAERAREPYAALGDFFTAAGIKEKPKAVDLGVISTYFTCEAEVLYHGTMKKINVLFSRGGGKLEIRRIFWKN